MDESHSLASQIVMDRLLNRYSQLKTCVGVLGDCYQLTATATATAIAECGESCCERVRRGRLAFIQR